MLLITRVSSIMNKSHSSSHCVNANKFTGCTVSYYAMLCFHKVAHTVYSMLLLNTKGLQKVFRRFLPLTMTAMTFVLCHCGSRKQTIQPRCMFLDCRRNCTRRKARQTKLYQADFTTPDTTLYLFRVRQTTDVVMIHVERVNFWGACTCFSFFSVSEFLSVLVFYSR